jgi:hypothetical protein
MNKSFTPRPTTRIKGFALATMLTLAMLVSIDVLATSDGPAPQMAQGQMTSRG